MYTGLLSDNNFNLATLNVVFTFPNRSNLYMYIYIIISTFQNQGFLVMQVTLLVKAKENFVSETQLAPKKEQIRSGKL